MRSRMLRRVLLPLALTWLVGAAAAFAVAYAFTLEAFDRALVDDARVIAAKVVDRDGQLSLELSERELRALLLEKSEEEFFAVLRPDGTVLAGNAELHATKPAPGKRWVFSDALYHGDELRVVTLSSRIASAYSVVVAQTTQGRKELLHRLVAYSVAPQVILLLWLGWRLRRSVDRELAPLEGLQLALERRDATDLTPLHSAAQSREVEHLAHTFNELMLRIGRGVQAQREFTGNVAHELRTPLAGIRALAEYGLAQADPKVWQEQLRSIAASQERASRLVDQLLALALADEARDTLVLTALRIDEIARNAVLSRLPRADAQGVDLGATGLDQPVLALGNVLLLEAALNNLIDNALRYGRPGDGERHTVTVEVGRQAGSALMSVTDNGPGIDDAHRDRLVQRWAQGRADAARGDGSGLGLAIVSRYAELLGGTLALESGPAGRGLRAVLTLPAAAAATGPVPALTAPMRLRRASAR
ncbi:MAG: sensor histidine kinase N-terminal domain-containing protein [Burkholderiaceae bacterium]